MSQSLLALYHRNTCPVTDYDTQKKNKKKTGGQVQYNKTVPLMRILFRIITISALKLVATHFSWYFSWLSTLRHSFFSVGSSISHESLSARHTSTIAKQMMSAAGHEKCAFRILFTGTARDGYNTLGQQPNNQLMDDGTTMRFRSTVSPVRLAIILSLHTQEMMRWETGSICCLPINPHISPDRLDSYSPVKKGRLPTERKTRLEKKMKLIFFSFFCVVFTTSLTLHLLIFNHQQTYGEQSVLQATKKKKKGDG